MLGDLSEDRTNEPNPRQGTLRYAPHESEEAFVAEVRQDIVGNCSGDCRVSLFLTHLNETDGCVVMKDEAVPLGEFVNRQAIVSAFHGVYASASEYGEDTVLVV